jgi:hypothetical protein
MPMADERPHVHRRYPHLTPEDVVALNAITVELGRDAARAYERELQKQWRDDKRARAHETPECVLGDQALEQIHARSEARWLHGAGGGRHVRRSAEAEE